MYFLRIDIVINGREYAMDYEYLPATHECYNGLSHHNWIPERLRNELEQHGCVQWLPQDEPEREIIRDILDTDNLPEKLECSFVMCLWQLDDETHEEEHLYSCFSVSDIETLNQGINALMGWE